MIDELELESGVISSMRTTAKVVRVVGTTMILYSMALVAAIFILDKGQYLLTYATVLASTGSGMIMGVSFAKAWQAQKE